MLGWGHERAGRDKGGNEICSIENGGFLFKARGKMGIDGEKVGSGFGIDALCADMLVRQ